MALITSDCDAIRSSSIEWPSSSRRLCCKAMLAGLEHRPPSAAAASQAVSLSAAERSGGGGGSPPQIKLPGRGGGGGRAGGAAAKATAKAARWAELDKAGKPEGSPPDRPGWGAKWDRRRGACRRHRQHAHGRVHRPPPLHAAAGGLLLGACACACVRCACAGKGRREGGRCSVASWPRRVWVCADRLSP